MTSPTHERFNISPDIIYEITINPDDKHQHATKGDSRIRNVKADIEEILKKMDTDTKYHMFPEFSHIQKGNQTKGRYSRIHYHGIIMFKTARAIRNFYLNRWHELTGLADVQLNVNTHKDYNRPKYWYDYCRKDRQFFKNTERICNVEWKTIQSIK